MDKNDFTAACGEVSGLHFPRWNELPEFDIYMDQVIALTERYLRALSPDGRVQLTPSMINNYVKSGALPPPKNKKYNRTHLALLMIICFAKSVMEISAISDLVSQSIAGGDIEQVLDRFAARYEAAIADAARRAAASAEAGQSLSDIAIEHALGAAAARTVAAYAYSMTATPASAEEPKPKAEKKAEKKAKKEAAAEAAAQNEEPDA